MLRPRRLLTQGIKLFVEVVAECFTEFWAQTMVYSYSGRDVPRACSSGGRDFTITSPRKIIPALIGLRNIN